MGQHQDIICRVFRLSDEVESLLVRLRPQTTSNTSPDNNDLIHSGYVTFDVINRKTAYHTPKSTRDIQGFAAEFIDLKRSKNSFKTTRILIRIGKESNLIN